MRLMGVVCWLKDPALFVDKKYLRNKNFSIRPCWSAEKNLGYTEKPRDKSREEQYKDFTLIFIRK